MSLSVIPISDPSIAITTRLNAGDYFLVDQVDNTSITGFTTKKFRGGLPGLSSNVQGIGVPGLDNPNNTGVSDSGLFFYQSPATSAASLNPNLRLQRDARYTGGTPGIVATNLFVLTNTSRTGANFEWGILSQMNNSTEATTAAQNVACQATINKVFATGFTNEIGPSWAANFTAFDKTGIANPTASCIGVEIDCFQVAGAGTDNNKQRVVVQMAWGGGGSGAHVGYGMLWGSSDATIMDRAIFFSSTGSYGIGLDFSAATWNTAPLFLGPTQRIVLDGATNGAYNRSLFYSSGSLIYGTQLGNVVTIGDAGNFVATSLGGSAPVTKAANYTMVAADQSIIFNGSGGITLTLLAASTYPGRFLYVKTIAAQNVVSASSNVVPLAGGAAGTALLSNTAGKWALLQSDASNWVIVASN